MRFLIGLLFALGLTVGCSNGDGGGGGNDGGIAGCGGEGGSCGIGGCGGVGGCDDCEPAESLCMNGEIDPTFPCCELPAPPDVDSACTGDESLENPASCATTGAVVTHELTFIEILGDCDEGYDLDECDGMSCEVGGLAPGEGVDGVDNAVAGLAPVLNQVEANLDGVNQALSDSLCGVLPTEEDDCAEGTARYELELAVDTNLEEGCANVAMSFGGEAVGTAILNVGAPNQDGNVCASGSLGTIPILVAGDTGEFSNALLRVTIVPTEGFTKGVLGVTVDGETAVAVAEAIEPGMGAIVGQVFDIKGDLSIGGFCDALSGTFEIGGVVVPEM